MIAMQKMLYAGLALLLSACGIFNSEDVPATLSVQNAAYATEIAEISTSAALEGTQAAATLDSARTQTAQLESVNVQLLATVAAGATPTQARIVSVETGGSSQSVVSEGGMAATQSPNVVGGDIGNAQITQVATASSIRAADGCADVVQSSFSASSGERIYVTAVAQNLRAGMRVEGNWFNGATLAATTDWVVPQDYGQLCIWFFISAAETPGLVLQAGQWSVTLLINGQPVGNTVSFTVQ